MRHQAQQAHSVSHAHGARSAPHINITTPAAHTKFFITKDAEWPTVVFQTDAVLSSGQSLAWQWTMQWDRFTKHGSVKTDTNCWDAKEAIKNYGGTLSVRVTGPQGGTATATVLILGAQPDSHDVTQYCNSQPNGAGFDKILEHETHLKNFNVSGYPIKSFDNGYGMAQLTDPAPTFEQCWNWKLNVDGGLHLFAVKRNETITYLSQNNRSYTNDQLKYETVSRWNGGAYHIWDGKQWTRNPDVLCDTQTGNIGWDLSKEQNKGKSESEPHKRDSGCYRQHHRNDPWGYYGVCYADRVLS